jgi:prepilin-type N-terminal cleavage/methylation domain-containing protein
MNMESFANNRRNRASGFTLVELLIAVAVGAIILVAALPSFSAVLHKNRISTATSQLYVSLNVARSEALKRRNAVRVCPSSNSSTCRNDGDWSDGWIIFDNTDGNGTPAAAEIIRLVDTVHGQVNMQVRLCRVSAHRSCGGRQWQYRAIQDLPLEFQLFFQGC